MYLWGIFMIEWPHLNVLFLNIVFEDWNFRQRLFEKFIKYVILSEFWCKKWFSIDWICVFIWQIGLCYSLDTNASIWQNLSFSPLSMVCFLTQGNFGGCFLVWSLKLQCKCWFSCRPIALYVYGNSHICAQFAWSSYMTPWRSMSCSDDPLWNIMWSFDYMVGSQKGENGEKLAINQGADVYLI